MTSTDEKELFEPVALCLPDGSLNPQARGWARQPIFDCNVTGSPMRKKKWNYWCITSPTHLFSITLSNVDYMGLAFAYVLDFDSKQFTEQTISTLFGKGFEMNRSVGGHLHFDHPQMVVDLNDAGTEIAISVKAPTFGGKLMEAGFTIQRPQGHETLNVVIPWNERRFQFTSKQECLPATGWVKMAGQTIEFKAGESFACLDYGRGIWKYATSWNWAAFSGKSGGHVVGANMGAKWTDGTGFTENGLVIDGKLVKIGEDMQFEYDSSNFMQPWKITAPKSGLIDLTFTPFFERVAKTEAVVLRSEVHQMIGRYDGVIRDQAGVEYPVHDLVGWAEEHHARW